MKGVLKYLLLDGPRRFVGYIKGRLHRGIYYVVEGQNWSIQRDGEAIIGHIRRFQPRLRCGLITSSSGLYRQIIHFGSIWAFKSNIERTHQSNRLIVTLFHGHPRLGPEMERAIDMLCNYIPELEAIVVANNIMHSRLRSWGVPEEKVRIIPLGVDLQLFQPPMPEQRLWQRRRLGIPDNAICIGSFQKDGVGWREGLEPKLIKGPDIFLEVVRQLAQNYPVFVLLTGPARGYVKRGLEANGIPYRHDYIEFESLPFYYHCLDLYLVTSREEGGPKALLESMATGVPLVSTRVGMVPDIIEHERNGIVVEVEDVDGLVHGAKRLIQDSDLRNQIVRNALRTVQAYDWRIIAQSYYEGIYAPLLFGRDS